MTPVVLISLMCEQLSMYLFIICMIYLVKCLIYVIHYFLGGCRGSAFLVVLVGPEAPSGDFQQSKPVFSVSALECQNPGARALRAILDVGDDVHASGGHTSLGSFKPFRP